MTARPLRIAGPIAVLVLCALGTLATGQVQEPARADLSVTAILITPEKPAWIHGVPTAPMEVRVRIDNEGDLASAGYRIDYHWVKDGQATWLNGNEESSFGLGGSLERGSHRWDDLKWTLQQGQQGIGAIRATLRPASPESEVRNDVGARGLEIPAHWVVLDVAGPARALHDPQDTAFTRIHLRNLGNVAETVRLALDDTETGDASRLVETLESSELTIPAQSSAATTLFVDYEFTGVEVSQQPFTVRYGVQATTAYGRALEAMTPAFTSSPDQLPAGSPADLQRVGGDPVQADPGDLVTLPMRLTNTGPSADTYLIDAALAGHGWTGSVPRPRIGLAPGESASFHVQLGAREDADLGSNATLRVHAQSARDATLARPSQALEIPLRIHGPSVRLTPGPEWPANPYLGDEVTLPVEVSNLGDQATPPGVVHLRIEGAWHETKSLPVPVVQPGKHTVLLFPAANPRPGAATIFADWSTTGASIANQGMTQSILVHKPGITVTAPPGLAGGPGEIVGYRTPDRSFTVRNDGNAAETLRLHLAADAGNASTLLDSLDLVLAPQERRSIPFEHRIPLPAGNGTKVEAQLTVSISGRPDLQWRANVTTAINDTRPPVLRLVGPPPTEWALGEPLPLVAEATDDSAVKRVTLNHTAPGGGPELGDLSATANPSQWQAIVPIQAAGRHRITVRAEDAHGNVESLALPPINVSDIPPPILQLAEQPEGGVDGDHVFSVRVQDVRRVSSVSVQVFDKQGKTLATRELTLDENGTGSFNLRDVQPGPLTLVVQARNAAGARAELTQAVVLLSPPPTPTDTASTKEAPAIGALAAMAVVAIVSRRRPK